MSRKSYSILRYTTRELVPLYKLDLMGKISTTLKYLYIKNFKETIELSKRVALEKKYYNKSVVLKKFLIDTVRETNANYMVVQIDNSYLDVLDDVLNGCLELADYDIIPVKLNPNIRKFVKSPHPVLKIIYKGGVVIDF